MEEIEKIYLENKTIIANEIVNNGRKVFYIIYDF